MARFQLQTQNFGDFNHACDVISDRFPEVEVELVIEVALNLTSNSVDSKQSPYSLRKPHVSSSRPHREP